MAGLHNGRPAIVLAVQRPRPIRPLSVQLHHNEIFIAISTDHSFIKRVFPFQVCHRVLFRYGSEDVVQCRFATVIKYLSALIITQV